MTTITGISVPFWMQEEDATDLRAHILAYIEAGKWPKRRVVLSNWHEVEFLFSEEENLIKVTVSRHNGQDAHVAMCTVNPGLDVIEDDGP